MVVVGLEECPHPGTISYLVEIAGRPVSCLKVWSLPGLVVGASENDRRHESE